MATFPALRPVARRYSLPVYQVTVEEGFSGGEGRFIHSSWATGHTLELQFERLTNAELKLIRDHYRGQEGGFLSFPLSSEAWAGNSAITADLGPVPVFWRYSAPPSEASPRGGIGNLTVSLESVA